MIDEILQLKELLEQRKSFPKHEGRKGKRGGSLPKDNGSESAIVEQPSGNVQRFGTDFDVMLEVIG